MPFHTYPLFSVGVRVTSRSLSGTSRSRDLTLSVKVIRDWAAIEGGAKVGKFTPPDYGPFGCGPEQLRRPEPRAGWGSDAVGSTSGSNVKAPRKVVIKLPKAVTSRASRSPRTARAVTVPTAGVKKFKIETKTNGGQWITAFIGAAPSNGKLIDYVPHAGKANVRFVRFTMLSNHGDPLFMDVMEFSVRGK